MEHRLPIVVLALEVVLGFGCGRRSLATSQDGSPAMGQSGGSQAGERDGGVAGAGATSSTGGQGGAPPTADAGSDASPADGAVANLSAPRLLAPLSTATVTSRRPTLHWSVPSGADGARVQICADRACARTLATIDSPGNSGQPPADLPSGLVFWRAFGRSGDRVGPSSSATWEFVVGARTAPVDSSWGTIVDLNGDGFADVVIGASSANVGIGQVYVYRGSAAGLSVANPTVLSGQGIGNEFFGESVASAGDVNGDGYGDLIIGAHYAAGTGQAYIYLGGANGITANQQPVTLTGPDGDHGEFGISVSSAGDVNGDGYADVVVGAEEVVDNRGRAYIYLGSAAGVSATQSPVVLTGPDGVGGPGAPDGYFGHSVASAGDVNGDGFGDLIVGAAGVPRAYVYYGSASGLSATATPVTLSPPGGNGVSFGQAAAGAGDLNGDGYADVIVGDPAANIFDGRAYVYWGSSAGVSATQPPLVLATAQGDAGDFGGSVSSAGDIDGDGYADLIVGADAVGNDAGQAYVFFGGASDSLVTTQPVVLTGLTGVAGGFGAPVAGAGDIDGDGFADVMVSAPRLGNVYFYRGGATRRPSPAQPALITGPAAAGPFFGSAIASLGIDRARRRAPSRSSTSFVECSPALTASLRAIDRRLPRYLVSFTFATRRRGSVGGARPTGGSTRAGRRGAAGSLRRRGGR